VTRKPRRIIFAGYLVRCPLGGYAWQIAHYLLGLRALGHEVWFYEDSGEWDCRLAYNPVTDELAPSYDYGIATTARFFDQAGCGNQWLFVDCERGVEHGPGAGRAATLLREADLLISFGAVNRLPVELRSGRLAAYIDADPIYTQLRAASGELFLRNILDAHTHFFTFGENIPAPGSPLPTGGYVWHATRQPVAVEHWEQAGPPGSAYTTIGKWDAQGRDLTYQGETLQWRKRTEWLRCLDLPARTGVEFEMAMDVDNTPGDVERLTAHGWRIVNPLSVSADPWRYRDYICSSRGEFTVAKDMNVRLRSGWFSDRAACYLAAGRPVVEQDTGFGDVLPLGPGLHAFRTVADAADAIGEIEGNYARASAHAAEVAREYFAADRVLGALLQVVGL
jgi:hypothetical protein